MRQAEDADAGLGKRTADGYAVHDVDLGMQAGPWHQGTPRLFHGRAADPEEQEANGEQDVEGDDDCPQEPAHPSVRRDAQHRDGEGRLAPGLAGDGGRERPESQQGQMVD